MATRSVKIVPSFPDSLRKGVTGAGGRMLGYKAAITEAGAYNRQTRSLNQQADIANQRLSIARERVNLLKSKMNKAGTVMTLKEFLPEYRAYTKQVDARNDRRMKSLLPSERRSFVPEEAMSPNDYRKHIGIVIPALDNAPTAPQSNNESYFESMYQSRGGDAGAQSALRSAIISGLQGRPNSSNLGRRMLGYAEGGVVDEPQIAMVGERGKEFIVPENKVSPQMANQLEQVVGNQQGQRVPNSEELRQLMSQFPEPEKMVSDRLPTVDMLLKELENYDSPEELLKDLTELDDSLMEVGMDLADVKGIQLLVNAVQDKFGPDVATQLMDEALTRRQSGISRPVSS